MIAEEEKMIAEEEPQLPPHRIVQSKKELHGWWNGIEHYGMRECTSERLLINPYNGCEHGCFFCYAHAFPGHFTHFRNTGVITVFKDFDKVVEKQLNMLKVASCGYLSPVTDPFQPINEKYRLSEKIIEVFIRRNIPVEVVTKGVISDGAIKLLKQQEHSFAQISILTLDEMTRKWMMKGGACTAELLRNIERLSNKGIFTVCRIDPVLPYITSGENELKELIGKVVDAGASHIITSCLDIPKAMARGIYEKIESKCGKEMRKKYELLYVEDMSGRKHARIEYRKKLFGLIKAVCKRKGVPVGLCMEFEKVAEAGNGNARFRGLNQEFMTSRNCEGIDIPIYVRQEDNDEFSPVDGCNGNCLACYHSSGEPGCGIEELKSAGAWKLKDYKRWSTVVF
ncbi:MAG: radical SAM protein [Methanophagales archaeon]|nr:radical SAM protein [Methanophagales archaeon]